MKYQLLATDLDGTLLNQKKELTTANRDMINRALDAGITVVFSSGRCLEEMRDLIPCFPKMRYAICLSGGCVFDLKADRPLFETPYNREILEAQYDFCREKDAMGMILTGRNLYLEERFYGHLDLVNMGHYSRSYEKYVTWVPDLSQIVYDRTIPIDKFNFYFRKEEEREECFRVFEGAPLEMVKAEKTGIECNPSGVSKGEALKELCRRLSIPVEASIAIGDSDNDLSMLKAAGLPLAVAGSTQVILDAADFVTADCDHDAVAEALQRWVLNN